MGRSRSEAKRALPYDYPVQGDDEDDPAPLPSWLPDSVRASHPQRAPRPPSRRDRIVGWLMLGLGCVGVMIGLFVPGTHTEVLLGALLLILGLRVLSASSRG